MKIIEYTPYNEIINKIDINEGDKLLVSSDIVKLFWNSKINGEIFDTNIFIDSIISKIGLSGTLLFPTYNWNFCKGIDFDYYKTKSKTGVLSQAALERDDFKRTKHPIYSFAVWGKDKDLLCNLENKSAFGIDSPFSYLHHCKAKNLLIDIDYKNSFTFVHYVEEQVGSLCYRYLKNFQANYNDEQSHTSIKEYSMYVRDLDLDVKILINPMGKLLENSGTANKNIINNSEFILIDLYKSFPIIKDDIIRNKSRNICSYIGQED